MCLLLIPILTSKKPNQKKARNSHQYWGLHWDYTKLCLRKGFVAIQSVSDGSVWCSSNKPLWPIIYILSTSFKRNVICLHEDHTLWKQHLCVVIESCNGSKSQAEKETEPYRFRHPQSEGCLRTSELKQHCHNNMPEKITRDRREVETRVCSKL